MSTMTDKDGLVEDLRKRVSDVPPLKDEPDFITSTETLTRYLKSCDWNINDSEKNLRKTIEYRRETKPLTVDCTFCHDRPGYHSMRQVGFDQMGRPVIYTNFAQASTHKYLPNDSLAHVTYLSENAKKSMKPGVTTWVFIIDCTGMTLSACNPKVGYAGTQALADHYPERLGLVMFVNHNAVLHGVWHFIKGFIQPQTVAKMKLVKSKRKMLKSFQEHFSDELSEWLLAEIKSNKQKPLPTTQKEFWNPNKGDHDPRGCPSYIKEYIEPYLKSSDKTRPPHKPHPNIVDTIKGPVHSVTLSAEELKEREQAQEECTGSDNEEEGS